MVNARYAVIGNPVEHSKSPEIHTAFAQATRQIIAYQRLLAPLDKFRETIDQFRAEGAAGCNITVPFKRKAFAFATTLSARAREAVAVNTLRFDGELVFGDNTDGVGLVRDIECNLNFPIGKKRILLLGAGGAARGIIGPLLRSKPAQLAIANRTFDNAVQLATQFQALGNICVLSLENLVEHQFDLVINATSASLNNSQLPIPAACFVAQTLAYDLMYGKVDTPFMRFAKAAGIQAVDGLGMLVEQAAEAFFVWRGLHPDTAPVIRQLKQNL